MNKRWWDRWLRRSNWIQAAAELGFHAYARESSPRERLSEMNPESDVTTSLEISIETAAKPVGTGHGQSCSCPCSSSSSASSRFRFQAKSTIGRWKRT